MKKIACFFLAATFFGCGKEKIPLLWEQQDSGTSYDISAVHFLDSDTGFAVGGASWYYGVSLTTTNGGKTWVADSMANKQLFALDFNEKGEGVAAGIDGYVFSRQVQDMNWSFYRYPVWEFYRGVAHNEETTLLVGGEAYKSGMIVRLDANFQLDTLSEFDVELDAVCFVDDQVAIAVGYGLVLRSEDGGRSWFPLPVDGDHFRAIHFPSEKVGYIVGYAGTILKTEDGGKIWKNIRNGGGIWVSNVPFRALFFVDEATGYLAGEKGIVWKTSNGGVDWAALEGLPEMDYYDVHVIGHEGWLVGEQGAIIHFQD
ncbi:MAG: hypothetical protein IPL49_02385 [Saprospirales bacterium]|nr:hypothetical protein [Saprospirales bacterium]MBK8489765.1 hypothetical protein [Saprospirales bacterium]